MKRHWVHSDRLYRDRVVEVREMKSLQRGSLKPQPIGWEAKIELADVVITTKAFHPTCEEAVRTLIDQLHAF